jgi:hypothetical protein
VIRRVAAGLAVALLVGLLAPTLGPLPPATADAAATDLTLVTDAVYTVQPAHHRAHVTVSIVARNHLQETRTRKFYFDHAFLAVPSATNGFRVSGAKGAKVSVAKRTTRATLLRIDFGQRLYGGQERTYGLTFNLVDTGHAPDRQLRIGTNLVTLPIWAYASQGARGSTVRVRFPADYEVAVESGSFAHRATTAGGGTQLATDALSSPLTFFAYVRGQHAVAYADRTRSVTVGSQVVPLTIRAWAEDPRWARKTGDLFGRALPALHDEIGLDWPSSDPTVVRESVNREAGVAGSYDPGTRQIDVAYWADPLVVVHEAAHGWFNGQLLADRWANEGFAALYAQRVAAAIGADGSPPVMTDKAQAARMPLNAWAATSDTGPDTPSERYGFAASLVLAQAIADRAGDDALRRVWADAAANVGAYQPPGADAGTSPTAGLTGANGGDPEPGSGPPDWRGLLDLLEAETGRNFGDLWREWVVRPDEAVLLDARARARLAYAQTLSMADGWELPRDIRDGLRAWQFDAVMLRMADARTVLAQRRSVERQAAADGLMLPATMQQLFVEGRLSEASAEALAESSAIAAIVQAEAARAASDDILTRVGMLGENPDADLALARTDLAAGNIDGTLGASGDAYRAWTASWQEGRRRALLALAVLASVLVLGSALIGRGRRGRRRGSRATQAHRMRL